jgi:predicted DNA-binding transcriptional regulator AlpA
MAIEYVKKPTTDTTTAVVTDPTTAVVNHQHKAKPNKGHARALAVSGLDLNTPQRVLLGHVLTLLKTSDSTLKRRIAAGDFPPPDGIFGRRPYWHSATVRPHVVGSEAQG